MLQVNVNDFLSVARANSESSPSVFTPKASSIPRKGSLEQKLARNSPRPTSLSQRQRAAVQTVRTHGMFTGNAAHTLQRTQATAPTVLPPTSAAAGGRTPTAVHLQQIRSRRGSAPFGYGIGNKDRMATPPLGAIEVPSGRTPGATFLAIPNLGLGYVPPSANNERRKASDGTQGSSLNPPLEPASRETSLASAPSKNRTRSMRTTSSDEVKPSHLNRDGTVAPKSPTRRKRVMSLSGDPLLEGSGRGSNSARFTPATRNLRVPDASRRSFGGFDVDEGILKEISSDDASDRVSPAAHEALFPTEFQARGPRLSLQQSSRSSVKDEPLQRTASFDRRLSRRPDPSKFRRQSYASPEALIEHQRTSFDHGLDDRGAQRRGWSAPSRGRETSPQKSLFEAGGTPFQAFREAVEVAAEHPLAGELRGAAHRRGTILNYDQTMESVFRDDERRDSVASSSKNCPPARRMSSTASVRRGSTGSGSPDDRPLVSQRVHDNVSFRRVRRPSKQGSSGSGAADDDVAAGTPRDKREDSGANSSSGATRVKLKRLRSASFGDAQDPSSDSQVSPRHEGRSDDEGSSADDRQMDDGMDADSANAEALRKKYTERSAAEKHLYRASLNAIPLQFVVQEVDERIGRDRMFNDLMYFIPFMIIYTVLFLSRNISENYWASASLTSTLTDSPTYGPDVETLLEMFRVDTQLHDGTQPLFMSNDGTDVNNNVYGAQNYRLGRMTWIRPLKNILKVRSMPEAHRWLEGILVPSLWDCDNPEFENREMTRIFGNMALIGGARLRSLRVKEGCSPSSGVWIPQGASGRNRSLECYGPLSDASVDATPYCNVSNPAVYPLKYFTARVQQTTPRARTTQDDLDLRVESDPTTATATTASLAQAAASFSISSFQKFTNLPAYTNETLFPFLSCELTNTAEVSQQTVVNLRNPCSGHTMTLPFQSSCRSVQAAIGLLRSPLMEEVLEYEKHSSVLHELMGQRTHNVEKASCPAFMFHRSVRYFAAELFAYSFSTDSFFRCRMMLEVTDGGAVVPTYNVRMFQIWTKSSIFQTMLQGCVIVFVFNFVWRMFSDWSMSKKVSGSYLTFLQDPWNLMDVVNNVTLLASTILTALWWSASVGITLEFNRDGRYPRYFEHIEELFSMQIYSNSVNVVLIYLKVLKFLRINDRLSIMTRTLSECQQDIVSLMLLFFFIHSGFALTANSVFGTFMPEFRSVDQAFLSLLLALITGVDYDTMRKMQPTITPLFFWPFIVFEVFLLLNFFIAILGEGFAQVNQSMNLPTLDLALLRVIDEIQMVMRWKHIREMLMALASKHKISRIKALVQMHGCLQDHLRLSILAAEDVTVAARENIPMYFRDLQWWLPSDVFESLGTQYLLIMWEEFLYSYNVKERTNAKNGERQEFAKAVHEGTKVVAGSIPDVLSLEVQAEAIFDKLEKVPLSLVEWSIALQQEQARAELQSQQRKLRRQSEAPAPAVAPASQGRELRRRSSAAAGQLPPVAPKKQRSGKKRTEVDLLVDYFARPDDR